jgi:hypothetical protein
MADMTFPKTADLTNELRRIRAAYCDKGGELDVRLQVSDNGDWAVRFGDAQYDQDHRGFWGSSIVSYDQNLVDIAMELLDQAKEQYAIEH